MEKGEKKAVIKTYSGIFFDILNPTVDMIELVDIAQALSNICRFTGNCEKFYSVAFHSYFVSNLVKPEHALYGLLHDASEAYLGDVSSPLKALLPNYRKLEKNLMGVIGKKFGLDFYDSVAYNDVKRADRIMLNIEGHHFQDWPLNDKDWPEWGYKFDKMPSHSPEESKAIFLSEFQRLTGASI